MKKIFIIFISMFLSFSLFADVVVNEDNVETCVLNFINKGNWIHVYDNSYILKSGIEKIRFDKWDINIELISNNSYKFDLQNDTVILTNDNNLICEKGKKF